MYARHRYGLVVVAVIDLRASACGFIWAFTHTMCICLSTFYRLAPADVILTLSLYELMALAKAQDELGSALSLSLPHTHKHTQHYSYYCWRQLMFTQLARFAAVEGSTQLGGGCAILVALRCFIIAYQPSYWLTFLH